MPQTITHPFFNHESLESPPAGEDNHPMSEDTTLNLPQGGVERILARLNALEDKVDRRLQETRPMWEQVLVRLDNVESRLTGLEGGVKTVQEDVRSSLRRFERQVGLLVEDVLEVRADQLDVSRRMDRLEDKMTP